MPCSMTAAAMSSATPSGTLHEQLAGATTASAYEPGTDAQATRSPAARPVTSAPTASTTPAPSSPATNGSGRG